MSELLSSITRSGGDFITRFMGGGTFVSPNVLNVVLTPPTGQRVRLTHLSTSGTNEEPSVTVSIDGNDIIVSKTLSGGTPLAPAKFSVGAFQAYPAGTPPNGNYTNVTGNTDEIIVISGGALSTTVYYGYEFGE
tara:strand:- start:432 stop:833 length:402 start_codon:yes stop_codon:yes gene_type:complete